MILGICNLDVKKYIKRSLERSGFIHWDTNYNNLRHCPVFNFTTLYLAGTAYRVITPNSPIEEAISPPFTEAWETNFTNRV